MKTSCNEVVVLPQGGHSSVHNSRSAGEEVTDTRKKGEREILREIKKRKREASRDNL